MEQSLVSIDPALVALMHGSFGEGGALQPFVQETMLVRCEIAGTGYRDLTGVDPALEIGSVLPLKREPSNPHDGLAIMILDAAGHHLGYIPRAKNEVLARLMDAGKLLFGRLEKKEWVGDWLRAEVRVFMRDF